MYDDLQNGDVVKLTTGQIVHVTDVAEAPETLFVYSESLDNEDNLGVMDRAFIEESYGPLISLGKSA